MRRSKNLFLTFPFIFLAIMLFMYPRVPTVAGSRDYEDHDRPGSEKTWEKAEIYITAKGTNDRIARKESAIFVPLMQPDEHEPTIVLDQKKTFQTIVGIGGALTDAAAETFYKLPVEKQQEVLTALFDKEKGNGYSMGRTNIHSCDFSSESYTYAEIAGDTSLTHFSIRPDLKYKIPFIKCAFAKAGGEFKLLASPWSPPAWMKTNNDMLHGGKLLPEYNQTWASYFVRFIRE